MRPRTYHYLEPAKPFKRPEQFITLGVAMLPQEADKCKSGKRELVCAAWHMIDWVWTGSYYQSNRVRTGERGLGFRRSLKSLLEKGRCRDLWTVNAIAALGSLDFWTALEKRRWIVEDNGWQGQVILSDPPTIIVARPAKGAGTVRILDLKNLGVDGLEGLREATHGNELCSANWFDASLDADRVASYQAFAVGEYLGDWYETLERERLGEVKPTLAGQCWSAYRHRFLDAALLVHANKEALALEQAAIYPGRTECFHIGKINDKIFHLDFSSYYASICRRGRFPARLRKVTKGIHGLSIGNIGDNCIAEVLISTQENIYPKRLKLDGSIIWPVGTFRTTLAGQEFNMALKAGEAVEIYSVACYDNEPLFAGFAEWAIEYRSLCKEHGDRVGEMVAKLFTNALWGMFAKRQSCWRNDAEVKSSNAWGDWYETKTRTKLIDHVRSVGWLGQRLVDEGYHHDACPQITACVNAAGRMKLLSAMAAVQEGRVYYVATDSLFVDEAGYFELCKAGWVADGKPGYLKVKSVNNSLDIRGIHDYTLGEESKVAGRPIAATMGESGSWQWESFERPTGALKRGERPGPYLVPRSRGPSEKYRHGIVSHDGTVSPIVLNER